MKALIRCACLVAASWMTACDGGQGPLPEEAVLATQESPLATASSQGCTFTLSYLATATLPPTYDIIVMRQASASCPWPEAKVKIANSTQIPALELVGNHQGVAAAYLIKSSFSGSSPVRAEVQGIAPATLQTVRTGGAAVYLGTSSIYSAIPSFEGNGTTLFLKGRKGGVLSPDEPAGYAYYLRVYRNFFTSTEPTTTVVY